ncbi:MAG TPA: FecR domain-containing protein, partial [Puia sp.]|nr:FecR domain-containing protein [Puia sp.]
TLTLSNGSQIALDGNDKGIIAYQGNARIEQPGKGRLEYNAINKSPGRVIYNTLTTPRAAQFQVLLPDGSRVWLNSSSTLRYPAAFAGKAREVELKGEAYFEVSHNSAAPFIVKVCNSRNDLIVQALGTRFNIMAYDNESNIRTTLLSGQVNINKGGAPKELKPGQQAQLDSSGKLHISEDLSEGKVTAWKDGNFYFERADIQTVMRALARWYDVEVEYNGNIIYQNRFVGLVSRNTDLSKVLDFLRQSGIHLNIEGRKIIVSS